MSVLERGAPHPNRAPCPPRRRPCLPEAPACLSRRAGCAHAALIPSFDRALNLPVVKKEAERGTTHRSICGGQAPLKSFVPFTPRPVLLHGYSMLEDRSEIGGGGSRQNSWPVAPGFVAFGFGKTKRSGRAKGVAGKEWQQQGPLTLPASSGRGYHLACLARLSDDCARVNPSLLSAHQDSITRLGRSSRARRQETSDHAKAAVEELLAAPAMVKSECGAFVKQVGWGVLFPLCFPRPSDRPCFDTFFDSNYIHSAARRPRELVRSSAQLDGT